MISNPKDEQDGPADDGASPRGTRFTDGTSGEPAHPLEPLLRHLAELREYISYYFATQTDKARLKVVKVALYAAAGLMAGFAGAAGLVAAVVMLLDGAAGGLSALLETGAWAGQLIVGSGVILIVAAVLLVGIKWWTKTSRQRMIQAYERRRSEQRAAFGRDVAEQAASDRQTL